MSYDYHLSIEALGRSKDLEYEWAIPRRVRVGIEQVQGLLLPYLVAQEKAWPVHPQWEGTLRLSFAGVECNKWGDVTARVWTLDNAQAEYLLHFLRNVPCIVTEGPRSIAVIRGDPALLGHTDYVGPGSDFPLVDPSDQLEARL